MHPTLAPKPRRGRAQAVLYMDMGPYDDKFWVQGLGLRVCGLGFRVLGLGFTV